MSSEEAQPILCPFCGYKAVDEYRILLHMAENHPEDEEPSPFVVKDDASIAAVLSLEQSGDVDGVLDGEMQYVACPVEGCGEAILLRELESHVEMHCTEHQESTSSRSSSEGGEREGEGGEGDEPPRKRSKCSDGDFGGKLEYALRGLEDQDDVKVGSDKKYERKRVKELEKSAKEKWKAILKMPEGRKGGVVAVGGASSTAAKKRLGKKELGPHANEDKMPSSIAKILESDGRTEILERKLPNGRIQRTRICPNQADGIIPVIEQLVNQDSSTKFAYLCHPSVKHVSKLKGEGGFCGYRNIQMMCSYINGVKSQGWENFDGKVPTIFDIQNYIEEAWDFGINATGRVETGGIKGTRKYIGTPDAQALFTRLDISCNARAFKASKPEPKETAYKRLMALVENYFLDGTTNFDPKVRRTSLPPLYFQHPGHSMTIIGIEKKTDGSANLIVFDPMFHDSRDIMHLVGNEGIKRKHPGHLLKAYRRGASYLRRYGEFEVLMVTPPPAKIGNITRGSWNHTVES